MGRPPPLPKREIFHGIGSSRTAGRRVKDAYSAEKQALRCMQKTLRKASAPALREGIQMHIEQTQVQIERVEQAMEKLDAPGRKVCEAMRGLVEEAQHEIGEQDGKGPILDLVIVAGMQRIEHYEIAAYGTESRWPRHWREEWSTADRDPRGGEADRPQADRSHEHIMPEAMAGGEEKDPSSTQKKPARTRTMRWSQLHRIVISATEPRGRSGALEAAHRPVSALQATTTLFQSVVSYRLVRWRTSLPIRSGSPVDSCRGHRS